ncbi:PHF7 protein, partial [Alcedo cyanopectus]|nr:PHF7 protein [Ceyx cyanopectus]
VCDGLNLFKCPHCRERDTFQEEMWRMGVHVPDRLVSLSLDPEAHAEFSARHGRCDASECLCPGGREQAEDEGPWQLLLCSSCAAEGTHRHCSFLGTGMASWECQSCVGPSAGKRQISWEPLGWAPAAG